jgi:coenzyme F420-reducing hydrogenase delta subunit/ferredoxin
MSKPLPARPEPADAGAQPAESGWQPEIVAMVCRWCTYAGADLAGTSRLTYPAAVRLVRFPCTGRMNPLFIVKAFENGADGVLVSGCHPGDCHYVQGNLYARRRFATFKALMEFLGLDTRRLHFSWVSASEGSKWVSVVKEVTAAVREVGPARPPSEEAIAAFPAPAPTDRAPASAEEQEALTRRLRDVATELLGEGETSVILGYRRGTLPGKIVPGFVTRPEEAAELVWDSSCFNNLSVYLPRPAERNGKVGAVVKKCDVATVVGLLQEGQLRRDDLHLIGVQCAGVWDGEHLAEKCRTCDGRVPPLCDVAVAPDGVTTTGGGQDATAAAEGGREAPETLEADPRDEAIAYLESLPPATRWRFWQEQFDLCLRCYACRAVCPLCYCETCIVEKHRPQWISPAIDETGNTAWNIVRAFHLAGRCTGCDECARVCPADIRLDLINRKLAQVVEQRFGYRAGADPDASPPLTEFRDDDSEEFIL